MKRSGPPRRKTPLKRTDGPKRAKAAPVSRASAPKRKAARSATQRARRPDRAVQSPRPAAPWRLDCFCGCGAKSAHWHHLVKQTVVERYGGDLWDPRNLVPMAVRCHGDLEFSAFRRFPLARLPDEAIEFAFELMGAAAYDELRRRYEGADPRLDDWLGRA